MTLRDLGRKGLGFRPMTLRDLGMKGFAVLGLYAAWPSGLAIPSAGFLRLFP